MSTLIEIPVKRFVLCFPTSLFDFVWLARKTRKIGVGRLNGYGGKIEEGETSQQAAIRELHEESGLLVEPPWMNKIGLLKATNIAKDGSKSLFVVFVYQAAVGDKKPTKKSKEMVQHRKYWRWRVPLDEMMPADRKWFHMIWDNRPWQAEYTYGPKQKELIGEVKITFVDEIPES